MSIPPLPKIPTTPRRDARRRTESSPTAPPPLSLSLSLSSYLSISLSPRPCDAMRPGSEESNVAALPCFFQVPKQQAPQPAANRGVAVPAGKLKAATAGVGCPGAVGNMHVLGDIGNVVHATARSSTDPATGPAWINRPIIRRFSAQLLKKAQADPSKNGVELILNSSSSAGNPEAPFAVTRRLIGTGRTPTLMVKNAVFSFLFVHK
ncbi:hypothetical protein CFC21_070636 [Triticum aestivum]|uniref:Uncharacterized protein n=3 Tax=Triticum TaxID=4564 RepID=A0A3B6LGX3_WHEAT|nr:hypothetical protein CFC21_070636 [Triticum aestivum]